MLGELSKFVLAVTAVAITSATGSDIRRLPPGAFPSLPQAVRRTLDAERCLIPQTSEWPTKTNVVLGHFRSRKRIDVAVLCSRRGQSTVVVINGVTGVVLGRVNRSSDETYLVCDQGCDSGRFLYQRRLETEHATPRGFCIPEYEQNCPCKGSSLDGIDDIFEGKASETHCWQNGWHTAISGD